mmetsp:Transcript_15376/g.31205  ORF Transcript_15376/g.31205 Transcript_15376/m.31205 type:complete len:117 (-) Transcript_15376:501-851(-)
MRTLTMHRVNTHTYSCYRFSHTEGDGEALQRESVSVKKKGQKRPCKRASQPKPQRNPELETSSLAAFLPSFLPLSLFLLSFFEESSRDGFVGPFLYAEITQTGGHSGESFDEFVSL